MKPRGLPCPLAFWQNLTLTTSSEATTSKKPSPENLSLQLLFNLVTQGNLFDHISRSLVKDCDSQEVLNECSLI